MCSSENLKQIISNELKPEKDLKNVFGLDLTVCLIEPIKQEYKDFKEYTSYELWTVLEETMDGNGYKIYFDEETKMFGLGIKSNNDVLIDIGQYGTFLETLYSM